MNTNIEIDRNKLQGVNCSKCDGTGKLYDPKAMSKYVMDFCRDSGMSQNEFGRRLDLTKGFMSNLMNGKRRWTPSLVNRALNIVKNYIIEKNASHG